MGKHCCYGTCISDSRYGHRPEMEEVFFIPFPKPKSKPERCTRWIRACSREGFGEDKINKYTYICSKHFVGGSGPTEADPDPIPATSSISKMEKLTRKRKQPTDRLSVGPSATKVKRQESTHNDETEGPMAEAMHAAALHSKTCRCKTVVTREISTQTDVLAKETSNQSQSTQTVYDKYTLGAKVETIMLKNQMKTNVPQTEKSKESDKPLLNLDSIKSNDKKMRFFTGLTFIQFMALFTFLGDSVNNLIYWDSKKDKKLSSSEKTAGKSNRKTEPIQEMFICLLRLRRGYNLFAISHFCNLSQTTVRTIFTTWLQLLFCHFDGIRHLMFPDRSTLKKFAPSSFKAFKNVRCSIDCTEFFVEMPRDFAQQGNLYSNYKHHHTYKCLIAVAPNGAATFVSDLYEGSISDKDIFARCGILDYINPGDLVLADRGFTVTDLLNEKQAHLNIPAFLKGRTKLTPKEELLTRKIARARIHVERFNERLKKFRLISGRIPLNISHIANQAVFVASCLVNFQAPLAK